MQAVTLFQGYGITVSDYRCTAGPQDPTFAEQHVTHSISYVRAGSFGCRCRGQSHELVAGALLIGHPGDEMSATTNTMAAAMNACLSASRPSWSRPSATPDTSGSRAPWRRWPN